MKKDFGNRVYAETRIYEHATKDDNVFEVWLESYEIDLLHSRRRNMLGAEGWDGPAEVNGILPSCFDLCSLIFVTL